MNKNTKTYAAIESMWRTILNGTMLCIDPSTGSRSSRPGFAWYDKGVLKESGEITVDMEAHRSKKLYEISRTIREDFPLPDILVVEYIPPVTFRTGIKMNKVALMALQKAIGAIMAAHPFDNLLEIPPTSWRSYKPANYVKTDEMDAVCLGLCAVGVAKDIQQEYEKQERKKK